MNCSIAKTLDVVGEWWTLLIVRDALRGTQRFEDFQASLGIARSVLVARLSRLTEEGVLQRVAYQDHPPRYEYHLTDKGRSLAPVIAALLQWGDTWAPGPDGPPTLIIHESCGHSAKLTLACPHCGTELSPGSTRIVPGPGSTSIASGNAASRGSSTVHDAVP